MCFSTCTCELESTGRCMANAMNNIAHTHAQTISEPSINDMKAWLSNIFCFEGLVSTLALSDFNAAEAWPERLSRGALAGRIPRSRARSCRTSSAAGSDPPNQSSNSAWPGSPDLWDFSSSHSVAPVFRFKRKSRPFGSRNSRSEGSDLVLAEKTEDRGWCHTAAGFLWHSMPPSIGQPRQKTKPAS